MSSNYDSAKKILSGGYVPEASSMMANALATLALVDELRAAREATGVKAAPEDTGGSKYAYVLTRTFEDGTSEVVSIYTDQGRVRREVQDLNTMSATQNAGVTWKYTPHVLNKGV